MQVHISAQLISFPPDCACCGGEGDNYYTSSHSRTQGKRVVKYQSKSWDVPYCSFCLEHARLYEMAVAMGIFGGVLIAVGVLNLLFGLKVGRLTGSFGEIQTLLGAAMVAGCPFAAGAWMLGKHARDKMGTSCCVPGEAVTYLGWQGSVHKFVVRNADYRQRLVAANGGKVVNRHLINPRPAPRPAPSDKPKKPNVFFDEV